MIDIPTTNRSPSQTGFSLIEVLVAISLLLIALVGPMTFFARNSQSTEVANDRTIATFLAQEGAELIQKIRDDRTLQYFLETDDGWSQFRDDVAACMNGSPCGVSINESGVVNVIDCSSSGTCRLWYDVDANRSRFSHNSDGAEETQFIRTIELQSPSEADDREVEVMSRVQWESTALSGSQSVEVRTAVFNIFTAN